MAFLGCSHRVLMDEPSIEQVSPPVVCLDALPEEITIRGSGLQPVVHNLLGEPEVVLPAISLVRIRDGRGEPVNPQEVFVIPADPTGEVPPYRWLSDEMLQIDLLDSHGLRSGFYSLTVENPDGTINTLPEALLLHGIPDIDTVDAEVTPAPDRSLVVTVEGGPFYTTAASWPLFFFDGMPVSYIPARTRGCRSVAVQTMEVETCDAVEYVLPSTVLLEEDLADRPFFIAPFMEAACLSRHREGIDLAPCPVITSVEPRITCPREESRTVTITGTSLTFRLDADPMVAMGTDLLEPTLDGCEEGPGTRTCTSLAFDVPITEIDEVTSLDVGITDLVMEEHCLDPVARLSLAPPPQILVPDHDIEHDVSPATIWVNGEFLMWEGALPLVSFASEEPEPVDDIYYCDYLTGMVGETSLCTTILATVPAHLVTPGATIPFTVAQAPPIGCTSTVTGTVTVSEEP